MENWQQFDENYITLSMDALWLVTTQVVRPNWIVCFSFCSCHMTLFTAAILRKTNFQTYLEVECSRWLLLAQCFLQRPVFLC